MQPKLIARIGVKAWNDTSEFFQELPLSKTNPRTIEITSKQTTDGMLWTTKVTAMLTDEAILLHEPCIIKIRLKDVYFILGTRDRPILPTIKEGDLIELTAEYKSKEPPLKVKKVLSIAPGCE